MKLAPMSPDACGTLNALKVIRAIRYFEEKVARELVAAGYAELRDNELCVTDAALSAPNLMPPSPPA